MNTDTIVQQDGAELFTTSEAIAVGAGVEHRSVLQTLTKYAEDFERFGLVAFEMRARAGGQHGGGDQRIARLNERQATLLLTYARNTERVRGFKARLVEEFYRMSQDLQARDSDPAVIMARGLEAAQQVITQKDQQIAELSPRAQLADTFLSAQGDYDTRDAAQILRRDHGIVDIGQNRLRDWMQANGWLDKRRRPMQTKIDAGHLRLKPQSFRFKRTNGEEQLADPQIRVTPRGIEALARVLTKETAK